MPISVDLTQLSGYSSLTAGTTYSITAVAQGTGDYTSSNKSAASSYQMPQSMPVKGDIINIDMTGSGIPQQYRVLKINGNIAELFSMSDATSIEFDSGKQNTYEGKTLDTYLNTTWYNTLSATAKSAIVDKTFMQDSWYNGPNGYPGYLGKDKDNSSYRVRRTNASYGNFIKRHVYAMGIQDISDYLGVTPQMTFSNTTLTCNNLWTMFWNSTTTHSGHIWLRSAYNYNSTGTSWAYTVGGYYGNLEEYSAGASYAARPAFQIDLSKIEWN